MRNPTIWVPTRYHTNRAVESQKMDRAWKFWIYKLEELHYPCSENKGADQLRSYCEADLRLCFRLCRCGGSYHLHDIAHLETCAAHILKNKRRKSGIVRGGIHYIIQFRSNLQCKFPCNMQWSAKFHHIPFIRYKLQ